MIARAGIVAALAVAACSSNAPPESTAAARFELGRHLFYDQRLSVNSSLSCSSCHEQNLGFAVNRAVSAGATGEMGHLNAPGLANAGRLRRLTWGNPGMTSLELQIAVPMFGEAPVELGMAGRDVEIMGRFAADADAAERFRRAFPGAGAPVTSANALVALAEFVRGLESSGAPYDRYRAGDAAAMSPAAVRGEALFRSPRLGCATCHSGPDLTVASDPAAVGADLYFNMGLYGPGRDPLPGLAEFTFADEDRGRFRVPSLRNLALTAPYMHDGSVATLDDVVDLYAAGGRVLASGPHAGDGRANPNKAPAIAGFQLGAGERADLMAFFDTLTDDGFTTDPRYAAPR